MKITNQLAYTEAAKIDKAINDVITQYSLEEITTRLEQLAFLNFIRTIKTTLDILQESVMHMQPFISEKELLEQYRKMNKKQAETIDKLNQEIFDIHNKKR